MALRQRSMRNGTEMPGPSGVGIQPFSLLPGASTFHDRLVWVFRDTATRDWIRGSLPIPTNYVQLPQFVLIWSAPSGGANAVSWKLSYRVVAGDDAETLDPGTYEETLIELVAVQPSTAFERLKDIIVPPTPANFEADATLLWELSRDGTDGDDTLADSVFIEQLRFEYEDE